MFYIRTFRTIVHIELLLSNVPLLFSLFIAIRSQVQSKQSKVLKTFILIWNNFNHLKVFYLEKSKRIVKRKKNTRIIYSRYSHSYYYENLLFENQCTHFFHIFSKNTCHTHLIPFQLLLHKIFVANQSFQFLLILVKLIKSFKLFDLFISLALCVWIFFQISQNLLDFINSCENEFNVKWTLSRWSKK